MTQLLYLSDTYLFETCANIVVQQQDDKGSYVLLDQTIFYPKGGGQPFDQGILKNNGVAIDVTAVRLVDQEIRHYINSNVSDNLQGQAIQCLLDKNRRLLNARYHTAAHLLGNVVEVLYPSMKAIKGHSFPNEAYVEFQGDGLVDLDKLQESLNQAITAGHTTRIFEIDQAGFEAKYYKLPYEIPGDKAFRVMQIQEFLPVPCGGTHLANTREIGRMNISKVKAKNGIVRISYGLD